MDSRRLNLGGGLRRLTGDGPATSRPSCPGDCETLSGRLRPWAWAANCVFASGRAVLFEAHFEGSSFLGIGNFRFRKVERKDFVRELLVFCTIGAIFNRNESA